jgi:hypothetical protein
MSELVAICGTSNPNRRRNVVFVHGLNGDALQLGNQRENLDDSGHRGCVRTMRISGYRCLVSGLRGQFFWLDR